MEQREILKKQDWSLIIKELTLYSYSRFKFWNLLYEKGIKGYSPEEIAMEAIELVCTGQRTWDPMKSNLISFLKFHVIKGLVANLARSKEVRESDTRDIHDIHIIENYSLEEDLHAKQTLDLIRQELGNDKLLIGILNGIYDGLKRKDICEMLDIEIRIYNNAIRRLRTKLLKLKQQLRLIDSK